MNQFPNPALPALVNVANNVAYAIEKGYQQAIIDARLDELVRYLRHG